MGYAITQLAASPTIYNVGRGGAKVEWIVVHYTANTASAENEARYCARGGSGAASWHYCIDNLSIYRSVHPANTAWHAGNAYINRRSIGVEVCSAGDDFTSAETDRLRWLVRKLMAEYGVDAAHVIRHYDVADHAQGSTVSPHKCCPAPYAPNGGDPTGRKWKELHEMITADELELDGREGAVHRLYDANSGQHMFTQSAAEARNLASAGWKYEGAGWVAPTARDVLRVYNPNSGEHVFMMDTAEARNLVEAGWTDEGTAFQSGDGDPVHRLYDGSTHMYALEAEAKALVKAGWTDEGTAFRTA